VPFAHDMGEKIVDPIFKCCAIHDEGWISHTSRGCVVLPPFIIDALSEAPPPEGPLLPSLEKLVITGALLTVDTAL